MKYLMLFNINEKLTDTVYHSVKNARILNSILSSNEFRLTMSPFNTPDLHNRGNKRLWHFSTTRSTMGNYHKNFDEIILLELDGRELSHNFKSIPFNYYQSDKGKNMEEFEDRIITDKPVIKDAIKYIKAIYISNPNICRISINFWENIEKIAKENNIKLYVFDDELDMNKARKNLITKNIKKAKNTLDLPKLDKEDYDDTLNLSDRQLDKLKCVEDLNKYLKSEDLYDLKNLVLNNMELDSFFMRGSKKMFTDKIDYNLREIYFLYNHSNFKINRLNTAIKDFSKNMNKYNMKNLSEVSNKIYNDIKKGIISNPFLFKELT
jgi:hypothetical protein